MKSPVFGKLCLTDIYLYIYIYIYIFTYVPSRTGRSLCTDQCASEQLLSTHLVRNLRKLRQDAGSKKHQYLHNCHSSHFLDFFFLLDTDYKRLDFFQRKMYFVQHFMRS